MIKSGFVLQGLGGALLFLVWVILVIGGSRTAIEYRLMSLTPVAIPFIVGPDAAHTDGYFYGFSGVERNADGAWRWTDGPKQKICVKIDTSELEGVEVMFGLRIDVVQQLRGLAKTMTVNEFSKEFVCNNGVCEPYLVVPSAALTEGPVCLETIVPKTAKVAGDPRELGFRFLGLVLSPASFIDIGPRG